jgi:uncharacterized membrane protein YgcG
MATIPASASGNVSLPSENQSQTPSPWTVDGIHDPSWMVWNIPQSVSFFNTQIFIEVSVVPPQTASAGNHTVTVTVQNTNPFTQNEPYIVFAGTVTVAANSGGGGSGTGGGDGGGGGGSPCGQVRT